MSCKSSGPFACCLFIVITASVLPAQNSPTSDPRAIALATQSIAALTHGLTINDVKLTANVNWVAGPAPEAGTGVLLAKGKSESRIDLALNVGGNRIEVRNGSAGRWTNPDGTSAKYAAHNCWTDPTWFFPALSSLASVGDSRLVFSYIGEENWNGLSTTHLQVYQAQPSFQETQRLSAMDFYIDPTSLLVLGVGFSTHPDNNMNTDLSSEVRFADYRLVNGIKVPFYIQRIQSGAVLMDITVTDASFNSGISDSSFQVP
jgi:hypothetical protein